MLSHSNILSSKEIEVVVNQLNRWVLDGRWQVDEDQSDCISFYVTNHHESKDLTDEIKSLFSGKDLSIRYFYKTKKARIPNCKVKELYDWINQQSPLLPKEENYGYAGDGRINDVIEETMNAPGFMYKVSNQGLCLSFSSIVKKAFLAGNIHLIKKRLEFFNQLPVCDLIRVSDPCFDINKDIKNLSITTDFALVRFKDQLYFVNQSENRFHRINMTKSKRMALDNGLKPSVQARRLLEQDFVFMEGECIHIESLYLSEIILSNKLKAEQKADLMAFFDTIKLIQDGNVEYLFNDCDLVLTEFPPSIDTIDHLPIQANAAYVRCSKQLYFINKTNLFCKLITCDENIVSKFDGFYQPSAKPRKLTEDELAYIPTLTGFVPSFENDEAVSQLINPIALSQTKIYQDTPFTGVYDFRSLCIYLQSLHHAMTTSQYVISRPFIVWLESLNHAMFVGYDPKDSQWILSNSNNNKIFTFGNSEHDFQKLSASIIKGFFQAEKGNVKGGLAIMQSKIEGHGSDQNALEAMIQNWKNSDSFKALHQVIPYKAKLHDKMNMNWLGMAVKKNDTPTAFHLIDHGAEINFQDTYYKNTPLHNAVSNRNAILVTVLLNKQAQVNVLNEEGRTPLMIAVLDHNVELVKILLSANPKLDVKDITGHSALHLAVLINNPTIVVMLLNAGANPKLLNNEKCSPLDVAIDIGNSEVVHEIRTKMTYLDEFLECVLSGSAKMAKQYFTLGFLSVTDLNHVNFNETTNDTLLHLAAKNNNSEMVQLLLDYQLDPNECNASGETALSYAVAERNINIIKIFILSNRIKMDVGRVYNHPFRLLARLFASHLAEMIALLKLTSSFDANVKFEAGGTLLHYAAEMDFSLIDPLFQCGANPNARNDAGLTPLLSGIKAGNESAIRALLMNPYTDRHCKSLNHYTPLLLAISLSKMSIVKILLADKQVDRNYVNKEGWSALIYAVEEFKEEAVNELLQDDQVDLNVRGHDGRTALHAAVQCGHLEIVMALLEKGADPWICDHSGSTPRDLAHHDETAIIALLFGAMAKKLKVSDVPMTLFADAVENRDIKVGVAALITPVQTS